MVVGNSDVGGLSPGGLACMCASSIVELPSPEGVNSFSHHVSKNTFARFLVGCKVMSGRGSVCKSTLKAWVAYRMW